MSNTDTATDLTNTQALPFASPTALSRRKKQELQQLAQELGLPSENLKRTDLASRIRDHYNASLSHELGTPPIVRRPPGALPATVASPFGQMMDKENYKPSRLSTLNVQQENGAQTPTKLHLRWSEDREEPVVEVEVVQPMREPSPVLAVDENVTALSQEEAPLGFDEDEEDQVKDETEELPIFSDALTSPEKSSPFEWQRPIPTEKRSPLLFLLSLSFLIEMAQLLFYFYNHFSWISLVGFALPTWFPLTAVPVPVEWEKFVLHAALTLILPLLSASFVDAKAAAVSRVAVWWLMKTGSVTAIYALTGYQDLIVLLPFIYAF